MTNGPVNSNETTQRQKVASLLANAAKSMLADPEPARYAPLINLASELEKMVFQCGGELRSFCFLFALLLDDIRSNETGPVRWDNSVDEVRQNLLNVAGRVFSELGRSLEKNDLKSSWPELSKHIGTLVDCYLDGVISLNANTKGITNVRL